MANLSGIIKTIRNDMREGRGVSGDDSQNHSMSGNTYGYFTDEELNRVKKLINYFKNSDYEQPEIISTLYAVWNNRIIRKQPVTDDLLQQDFIEWDNQKVKYKDRLAAPSNGCEKRALFLTDGGE